jgi:hypothetical protein
LDLANELSHIINIFSETLDGKFLLFVANVAVPDECNAHCNTLMLTLDM